MAQRYQNKAEAKQAKAHKKALEKEAKLFNRLKKVGQSPEFEPLSEMMMDVVISKTMGLFVGKGAESWEDYLKTRGEVMAYLYILQQVGTAGAMEDRFKQELELYKEVE